MHRRNRSPHNQSGCYLLASLALILGSLAHAQNTGYVYVGHFGSNNISGFAINDTTGALTPVPGSPFAAGTAPEGVASLAVTPNGRFVLVADLDDNPFLHTNISVYNIDPLSGTLSPINGSPFVTDQIVHRIAVDPSGRFLYAATQSGIAEYNIDSASGAITAGPVVTSAFQSFLAPSPDGKFLFATSEALSTVPPSIAAFAINTVSGALSTVPGSPFLPSQSGRFPFAIIVHPSGRFAYITNLVSTLFPNNGELAAYGIDALTGALNSIPASLTAVGSGAESIAMTPSGNFLYVGDTVSHSVFAYRINALTGLLTQISGSPFADLAGQSPLALTVDPSGRFLYVGTGVGLECFGCPSTISGYSIDSATGALSPVSGAPFQSGGSFALTIAAAKVNGPLHLRINGIVPTSGGTGGSVSPRITGQGFQPGAQVTLKAAGLPDIVGQGTAVVNPFQLTTTFDLTGAVPGSRSVTITNPDGSSATADGFVIVQGGTSQLWVDTIGRGFIRPDTAERFDIVFGNSGAIDALGVHLTFTFPSSVMSTLEFGNEVGVVSTATVGSQSVVTVNLGRVAAGAASSLSLTLTAGTSQPQFNLDAVIRGK